MPEQPLKVHIIKEVYGAEGPHAGVILSEDEVRTILAALVTYEEVLDNERQFDFDSGEEHEKYIQLCRSLGMHFDYAIRKLVSPGETETSTEEEVVGE